MAVAAAIRRIMDPISLLTPQAERATDFGRADIREALSVTEEDDITRAVQQKANFRSHEPRRCDFSMDLAPSACYAPARARGSCRRRDVEARHDRNAT
jgi:hypothetical protein